MSEAIFLDLLERRELDAGDLVYHVGGSGPPLVLIHGLAGAAKNWVDLVPALVLRYRLVVPDLPGHGASGRGPKAMTLPDFAAAVRRCAEAEQIDQPVVVGHSFGGQIALQLAISEPQWLRAVVLAAASGISSGEARRRYALEVSGWLRPAKRSNPLRPWILRHRALRKLAFSGLVSDVATLSDVGANEFFAGAARAADTRTALRALLAHDLRTQLHRARAPAMVIWGARDAAVPVADGVEYARRLRAPLRVLADTGHLLIGERPLVCARLIDEFVESLSGSQPR